MKERVRLHGMAYGGSAVGRLPDGAAVFVPRGLPGETVEVEVVERKRTFARGRLLEVLEPAAERVAPPCPHFLRSCGGCQWQQASYPAQLAYKRDILADQLRRAGGIADVPALDPFAAPAALGYRNTADFHVAGGAIGFHREGSHDLVDLSSCPLMEPPINAALAAVRSRRDRLGAIRQVGVRCGADALQVTLLSEDDPRGYKPLAAELATELGNGCRVAGVRIGCVRTRGLHGDPFVHMNLAGQRFRVSPLSFFQVNSAMAEKLVEEVMAQVRSGDRVLDLFSGVGTFGLLAAERAEEVVGVEEHPAAMADAATNTAEAAAANVRWVQADVAASAELAATPWQLAILDPPRAGCPRPVLAALNAERIAYVSCDPSTLARDLKLLLARGYHLTSIRLFDMFPQTYHLEVLALLHR
ncbi:MAG: class I SAM-dependent RNA methyltransferase [Chloroflexota bacterium]